MASFPFIRRIRSFIQPRILAMVVSALLIVWTGIQWVGVIRDAKLDEADVAGREVRINQSKLEGVKTQLETYVKPTTTKPAPRNILVPDPANPTTSQSNG